MRTLVMLVMVMACGPSNTQIRLARLAEYKAPALTIYGLAVGAASEDYKIAETDETSGRFTTQPQFYNREGGRESPGAGDVVQIRAGSVRLEMLVEVVEANPERVSVVITPRTYEVLSGSPKPRELTIDDPSLPPWVKGRVDALAVKIYERAKGYTAGP
jgi:hypothetical protein